MTRKVFKIILYIASVVILVVFIIGITLWLKSPGTTEPISDNEGNPMKESIASIEKIALGGQEQYIIIRGVDTSKPIMLFLHGGPGSPEVAFMKHYNRDIEKDYVMVYWEQRGAGKSWSKNIPPESMNLEQLISDTRELSEYLAHRFDREKILLMGHSWGSLLGILTAYSHPELYHAYFGIGQVGDQLEGERISLEWAKARAAERNDTRAVKKLNALNFPGKEATADEWISYLMKERRYVNRYGGGTLKEVTGMWPLVWIVLNSGVYTLREKLNFMKASMFSLEHMWLDVIQTNLFHEIDSMSLPVYIFHGIHDYTTPYPVAKDFYEQLKAPQKEFYAFENSAHSPVMEEPEKFNTILRNVTRQY